MRNLDLETYKQMIDAYIQGDNEKALILARMLLSSEALGLDRLKDVLHVIKRSERN